MPPSEQNPYVGGGPTVGKVLIVCPVTLISVSKATISIHLLRADCEIELEE